jgi:hypothetical protein
MYGESEIEMIYFPKAFLMKKPETRFRLHYFLAASCIEDTAATVS